MTTYTDLIEVITQGGNRVFCENEVNDAEHWLNQQSARIRLDLHGVVDILNVDEPLPQPCCVISFVGKYSDTRNIAREEIMARINSGQILFGVLVFKRGSKQNKNQNSFDEIGSKVWVNSCLPRLRNVKNIFVDDSYDHYISNRNANIKWLYSYHFKGREQSELLEMIRKLS